MTLKYQNIKRGRAIQHAPFVYKKVFLLCLNGCHTGKHFALDGLEQGATTGGDVTDLVGHAKLVDAGYGVTTTDEREGSIGSCLGDGVRRQS